MNKALITSINASLTLRQAFHFRREEKNTFEVEKERGVREGGREGKREGAGKGDGERGGKKEYTNVTINIKKSILSGKIETCATWSLQGPEGSWSNLYRLLPPSLVGPTEAARAISFRAQSGLLMRLMGVQLTRAAASRRDELFGGAPWCPLTFLPLILPLVLYRVAEIYGRCPPRFSP